MTAENHKPRPPGVSSFYTSAHRDTSLRPARTIAITSREPFVLEYHPE